MAAWPAEEYGDWTQGGGVSKGEGDNGGDNNGVWGVISKGG